MTDDLVKRLEELRAFLNGEADLDGLSFGEKEFGRMFWWRRHLPQIARAADRIEELEAKLNFLVQPDSACPHASYRGWVIVDESDGNGTFWYAYTYDWKSGEWDSPHFMMVSGDFDDVTAEIDRRTGGQKDE